MAGAPQETFAFRVPEKKSFQEQQGGFQGQISLLYTVTEGEGLEGTSEGSVTPLLEQAHLEYTAQERRHLGFDVIWLHSR